MNRTQFSPAQAYRPLAAALVCIGLIGVSEGHASAQYPKATCDDAGWPPPPLGAEPDLNQCCYIFDDCYAANQCYAATDWPNAFSAPCLACNIAALSCFGIALTGEVPERQCPGSCDYKGVTCGAPDGCGGVCVSDDLCPFYIMHPEISPLLF